MPTQSPPAGPAPACPHHPSLPRSDFPPGPAKSRGWHGHRDAHGSTFWCQATGA